MESSGSPFGHRAKRERRRPALLGIRDLGSTSESLSGLLQILRACKHLCHATMKRTRLARFAGVHAATVLLRLQDVLRNRFVPQEGTARPRSRSEPGPLRCRLLSMNSYL